MYDSISSFTIILFITRPQIYIFSQGNFEIVFILQFFIFQVLLAIWIYLSLLINANDENNIINQIQHIQQNSKKTELIIQIISIFLFFNKIYLGHNVLEFCLLLILKSNNQPTYLIIFAFLQILQISTILILQWQVLNRSIKFIPILQHLTINQSYTNIFNLFLKFLQTIIYITTTQNALFGQSIIIFITFTHKIFQLEINNILMQNEFQQMIIQLSSLGIVLSLLGMLISIDDRISLRLWILILPVFYYIVNLLLKREFYSIMFKKNFHQMSISQLKYFSCLLHQGIDFSKQQNKLFIFSYIKRKKFFEEINYITDENINRITIQTITNDMMNQILKILEKLSEQQKNPFKLQQIYINYIQILIIQNKFVEAQTVMEQIFSYKLQGAQKMVSKTIKLMIRAQMNGTQRIYLEIMEDKIIDQIKKKMTQQTSLKTKNHQSISAALKQLSAINSYTIDVQTIFRNVLNYKIDFLNFVQRENLPPKQFSDKVHFTLIEMESLLKKLKQNYNVFPTLQNQSILMIYKVEILNNIFDAYMFSQTIALDEDIFLKHHQSDMFNFFNQSFNFIIFEIHDVQNIQIKYHCITQQNLFQIKEGDQLQSLIPVSLKLQHYYMVEHFLQTGKNKFFQAIDESYISIRPGVFCPIDICMDLNHLNTQNIEIITVYRSPQSDKQILFVDSNLKLQEISLHLFDFGFNLDDNQLQFLIGINIQKIIPNFKKYIDDKLFDIKNCPINFMTTFDEQDSKTKSKTYNYLDELEQISFYSCHLNIRKRYYQDEQYFYVLRIDNLKQDRTYSCSQFRMTQNSEPYQEVDEEIEINVPDIDDNEQKYQIVLNTDRIDPQIEILHENQDFRNPEQKITETSLLRINNLNQDAPQSHISSIEEIKKSPYFKTFQLLSSLIHSDKKSKNLISFNLLYFLYIILISTFSIKILVVTYELQDFISHVRLLSIKNEVYQPIESFLLTRYTILSYNILLSQFSISQSEHAELMKFPSSNLLTGFDDLKVGISKVLNYPEFQPFLEGNYLTIYLQENTNIGIPYNLSFRSSINLLLEYQYEYKLAYTVKQVLVDSPYFYYSYKNYVILFNQFVDLQNYTLDQTFNICDTKLQEVFLYFIIFIIITFIICSLKVYHLLQIRIIKNRILTLIKNQEFVQSDQEISRLKQLQLQIIQKRELVYNYNFDLQKIDTILKKKQKCFKQRQLNQKQVITLRIYFKSFLITFHYLLFLGLSFLFYMIMRTYLQDYQNTAQFYQKISDAGVNVLKVYAWKEALYFKTTFTFLNSNEILQIYDEVESSLQSLRDFSINLLNIDEMSYIFGSASEFTFQRLTKESICDNLSDKYYIKAQNICNNIMSGVLKRGLINTLNYIVNSIQIEQQQTNFTTKISYTKLELEGATLVSDIIQQLVDTLKIEFETQTKNLQLGLYIIISLYFSFELLSILFIIRFTKSEEFRLNLLKKFVYLIPAGTLFYDEYFQRAIKRIVFN